MRLAWRGTAARAGRRGRRGLWISLGVLIPTMLVVGTTLGIWWSDVEIVPTRFSILVADVVTATAFTLMLSQTLANAADALYQRGDLDLLFSSPLPPRRVLTVRFLAIALNAFLIYGVFLTPLMLPVAILGHWRWLSGLLVLGSLALLASAAGLGLAMALFRLIGARRTRAAAQLTAALIGASIFLATQAHTIFGSRAGSVWNQLRAVAEHSDLRLPALAAWPLRAALGEPLPLIVLTLAGPVVFAAATVWLAHRFVAQTTAASGMEASAPGSARTPGARFVRSPFAATLAKELRLMARDAGLMSQVLMRVLYLLPLGFLLLRNAGSHDAVALPGGAAALSFMAGQVAGSLAWITISAEDAPDLLASAPTPIRTFRRAKLAAAFLPLAILLTPLLAVLIVLSPTTGLAATAGCVASAVACGLINIWHQRPAKRSEFRRQRGSLWAVTLAELLVGGVIAMAAAMAAAGSPWFLAPALVAVSLMVALRRTDAQIAQALRRAA
jgi:ABC-2 type transport system permease protein